MGNSAFFDVWFGIAMFLGLCWRFFFMKKNFIHRKIQEELNHAAYHGGGVCRGGVTQMMIRDKRSFENRIEPDQKNDQCDSKYKVNRKGDLDRGV